MVNRRRIGRRSLALGRAAVGAAFDRDGGPKRRTGAARTTRREDDGHQSNSAHADQSARFTDVAADEPIE